MRWPSTITLLAILLVPWGGCPEHPGPPVLDDDDGGDDDAGDDDGADDDTGDDDGADDDTGDDDGADDDTGDDDGGDDDTTADPCLTLAPSNDGATNRQAIEACLASGQATLTPGTFPLDQGFDVPPGSQFEGAGLSHTELVLQGSAVNHVLAVSGTAEVAGLTVDAADALPANANSAVIHVTGADNHVHDCWLGNSGGVSQGTKITGVYIIDPSATGNLVEGCEITGNFYGVIWVAGLPPGSANVVRDSVVHDNRCDGLNFPGYGEAIDNEVYHHGWDCENGPIPGAHVYALWNTDGALLEGNTMYRSCGHGIDVDGVANLVLEANVVSEPGHQFGGQFPYCGGAAAIAMMDSSHCTLRYNVAENHNAPQNAGADPNSIFHAVGDPAFADLPAGANTTIAFWNAQRSTSPGASQGHTIHQNALRSSCTAPCVGVGYFSSRGTGTDAALGWSAKTTAYYTSNNPFGSDYGSVRCGANWYAANSTCPENPTDPDCNTDDWQHTFDWSRNDDCRDF